jgi:hypothetical protein
MAAADRDNPYWRLDDLMARRVQVPDAENSALVLARVVELVPEEWPEIPATTAGGSPTGESAAANAYAQLQALAANVRPDPTIARVLRSELKARETAVAVARTVAGYPRGRHELVLATIVTETSLRETQEARRVARLLVADAAVRAEDGNVDGALESCRAILATARSIGDEPTLISTLVRISIDELATKSIGRVLGQGEPSDTALAQLQAIVLDEHAHPVLLTGLNGERAMLDEVIRRVEQGRVPLAAVIPGGTAVRVFTNLTGGLGGQRALTLEWMNEAVAIARRPTFEQSALASRWNARISDFAQKRWTPLSGILALNLTPGTSAAVTAFLRSRAELGATAILIAAERHRRQTGDWPASIREVNAGILPQPPADPYNGRPFHIERRDGQLRIYTVGMNGNDEHGEDDPKLRLRGGPDDIGTKAWDPKMRRQPPVASKPATSAR